MLEIISYLCRISNLWRKKRRLPRSIMNRDNNNKHKHFPPKKKKVGEIDV